MRTGIGRRRWTGRFPAVACALLVSAVAGWGPSVRAQATNTIDIVTEGGIAPGSYHVVTDEPCVHGFDGWSVSLDDTGTDLTEIWLLFSPDAPDGNRLTLEFDPGSEPFTHYYSWGGPDLGVATVEDRGDSATLTMTMTELLGPQWDGTYYDGGSATVTVECSLIDRLVPYETVPPAPTPRPSPPRPANLADGRIGWWRQPLAPSVAAPARDSGSIYLGRDDSLVALDAATGTDLWQLVTGESMVGVGTGQELVVAAGADGLLVAASADGTERWRRPLGMSMTVAPLVTHDAVYAVAGTTLMAVDALSGEERWRADEGGSILGTPLLASGLVVPSGATLRSYDPSTGSEQWSVDLGSAVSTAPTLVGDTLVAGDWDGEIVGVDPGSGSVRWRSDGHAPFVLSPPAASGSVAVLTDDSGDVTAVDVVDGSVRWSHEADTGWAADGTPVIEQDTLYLVDVGGVLHVIDADTGQELWSYLVGPTAFAPLVMDGMIHVRTDDALVALGPVDHPSRPDPLAADHASGGPEGVPMTGAGPANTGRHPGPDLVGEPVLAWRNESLADIREPIVAGGGRVFAIGGDGNLYALEPATGDILWRFAAGGLLAPALTGDVAVVADQFGFADSNVYAVDVADGRARWHVTLPGVLAAPMVTDGERAYASLYPDGGLVVFDIATGDEVWRYEGAGPPAISAGIAYVLTHDSLVALDAASGAVRWQTALDFAPSLVQRVSVGGGAIYVPHFTETLIFDATTGAERGPSQLEGGETSLTLGDGVGITYVDGRLIGSDLVTGAFRWFSGPVADMSMLDVGVDQPVRAAATQDIVYAATTDGSGDVIALDPASGEERWRFPTGATGLPLTTPAVLGGMVVVGTGAGVVAITGSDQPAPERTPAPSGGAAPPATPAAPTGDVAMSGGDPGRTGAQPGPAPAGPVTEVWRVRLDAAPAGAPVVAGDLLAVIDSSSQLVGLDPATGARRWAAPIVPDLVTLTPVIDHGMVYAPEGPILHAVDGASGSELWQFYTSMIFGPIIDDGVLISNLYEGVAAVDVRAGQPIDLWRLEPDYDALQQGAGYPLTIAVADDQVYLVAPIQPSIDFAIGRVQAFDETNGQERWRRDDLKAFTAPAASGGLVIVGTSSNTLVALAAGTGETLWTGDLGVRPASSAAIGPNRVIVGAEDGSVVAFDRDGAEMWRFAADSTIVAPPAIAGDTLVVASRDGVVYALDTASGAERWRFETGGTIEDPPSVVDGLVFVSSGEDVVAIGGG
jgi:outer membrane protein assembly factor BamB